MIRLLRAASPRALYGMACCGACERVIMCMCDSTILRTRSGAATPRRRGSVHPLGARGLARDSVAARRPAPPSLSLYMDHASKAVWMKRPTTSLRCARGRQNERQNPMLYKQPAQDRKTLCSHAWDGLTRRPNSGTRLCVPVPDWVLRDPHSGYLDAARQQFAGHQPSLVHTCRKLRPLFVARPSVVRVARNIA